VTPYFLPSTLAISGCERIAARVFSMLSSGVNDLEA
jgi:hypothetical protein